MAPAYAVAAMLQDTGLTLQDFDYYEIHEAFAAVPLCLFKAWQSADYCRERLGLSSAAGRDRPLEAQRQGRQRRDRTPIRRHRCPHSRGADQTAGARSAIQARHRFGLYRRWHGRDRDPGACMSRYETLMARDGHEFTTYIAKPAATGARRGGHRAGDLRPVALGTAGGRQLRGRGLPDGGAGAVRSHPTQSGARLFAAGDASRRWAIASRSTPPRRCSISPRPPRWPGMSAGSRSSAFCWGGTLAWAAASEVPLGAAVCYYGAAHCRSAAQGTDVSDHAAFR